MRLLVPRCGGPAGALLIISAALFLPQAEAGEAQWIWSAEHERTAVPQTECHFRKEFQLSAPQEGSLAIAADDQYEVFVNGRRVGTGSSARKLDRYTITRFLSNGRNVVAVRVTNTDGSTAALAVRLEVTDRAGRTHRLGTDDSWVTSLKPLPFWYAPLYNDARWDPAQAWGPLGSTPPWDVVRPPTLARNTAPEAASAPAVEPSAGNPVPPSATPSPTTTSSTIATPANATPAEVPQENGLRVDPEFEVDRLLDGEAAGSLIAMTFNEFGHIVASREGGELLLIYDSNGDQRPDQVRVYCDRIKDCQGLVCLNGWVYATGEGPDGRGLYRLRDQDRDGQLEEAELLIKLHARDGNSGPHGLALGSDGRLYLLVGSQTELPEEIDPASPYRHPYAGDLGLRPAALGSPAASAATPGGVLLRTDLAGEQVQIVAGGLHNPYDLAFDRQGELFTFDSDPEADAGAPWYRSPALHHVPAGAEFGWRGGRANWPEHYVDRLPGLLKAEQAAPTGMTFYRHYLFPDEYHDSLFVADWSSGRILNVRLEPSGASYTASSQVFLEGDELSISDLEVGPDGWLYFVTGGRGTAGGVYRVRWTGTPPASALNLGIGLSAVIRQPQLDSAWSRQNIAAIKVELGDNWDRMIRGVALSSANPWQYRVRALDLMQLYGPTPDAELLQSLFQMESVQVRRKAAELMGIHAGEETYAALVVLLADSDPGVRRKACEALVSAGQQPPLELLLPLLKSDDRSEAWAARRLLERLPVERWRDELLASGDQRLLTQAGLALMVADPTPQHARQVLERMTAALEGFVSDRDFVQMLRVVQVALSRGEIRPAEVPQLSRLLAAEFPSSDPLMNRELVRLLAYLQPADVLDRCLVHLQSDGVADVDKLHLAMHLHHLPGEWTIEPRMLVLDFFEAAKRQPGGTSYAAHLTAAARKFAGSMSAEELRAALVAGASRPAAALVLLYQMPERLDADTFQALRELDQQILPSQEPAAVRLKIGIAAVLARSGDADSLAYLRSLWDVDPERRPALAMGLAQWPSEDNWHYLVRSLPVLDGEPAREVLTRLLAIRLAPEDPEYYRQVILRGLQLGEQGGADAVALLEFWTGETTPETDDGAEALEWWQQWYAQQWPELPDPTLPSFRVSGRWTYPELLRYLLIGDGRFGSPPAGVEVFQRAQCAACHRFNTVGEDLAPDLTTLNRRAMKKEILESILFPSHVLAEQSRTGTVVTARGRILWGQLVMQEDPPRLLLTQADGRTVSLTEEDVDEVYPDKVSPMPEGLLDGLELQDIADLFALLCGPAEQLVERPQRTIFR